MTLGNSVSRDSVQRLLLVFFLFLISSTVAYSQDPWQNIKTNQEGDVVVWYYDSNHFISEQNGKISGIEYDLMRAFFTFLEKKHGVRLNATFSKAESFGALYQNVKKGSSGEFGACSFSITKERKKDVNFSPKYMPDIEVLISSNNIPITEDTSSFIQHFSIATALSIANTTFDEDLKKLSPLLPELKVKYLKYSTDIGKRISKESNLFSYIELPNYILSLEQGIRLKRQPLFKVEREGYAFIFPLSSDWNEPINEFFSDPSFKSTMNKILKTHLGNDIKDLLWEVSGNGNTLGQKEISLLTKEREIQQLELEKQQLELHRQKLVKNVSFAAVVVFILLAVLLYNRSRMRKRANELLYKQNEEISRQKQIIEEKNTDIIDSLTYAKRIQQNILPSEIQLSSLFPESFVLYKPKDIVAGDFYFVGTPKSVENKTVVAVGDCTGHGVPGALLSIIGNTFLQMSLSEKEVKSCADALNYLNTGLINVLKNETQTIQDGMDIAICSIDSKTLKLEYSGANNPVFIVQQGNIVVLEPQKRAIGQSSTSLENSLFVNKHYQLQKGDTVYLLSDGFADQFGGEKGKKFKSSKLKELILSIQEEKMEKQGQLINQAFENWKGSHEQVDDVCLIGIRV